LHHNQNGDELKKNSSPDGFVALPGKGSGASTCKLVYDRHLPSQTKRLLSDLYHWRSLAALILSIPNPLQTILHTPFRKTLLK
jgi:hypothetical protein